MGRSSFDLTGTSGSFHRMNKVLVLCLFTFTLVALSAVNGEEQEEKQLGQVLIQRAIREADPKKKDGQKKKNVKKGRKNKEVKKDKKKAKKEAKKAERRQKKKAAKKAKKAKKGKKAKKAKKTKKSSKKGKKSGKRTKKTGKKRTGGKRKA